MRAHGTHSPFAALHKSGSYRVLNCRAFTAARPVSLDPKRSSVILSQRNRSRLAPDCAWYRRVIVARNLPGTYWPASKSLSPTSAKALEIGLNSNVRM